MRRITKAAAAALALAAGAVALAGTGPARAAAAGGAAPASTVEGCPRGYVCLYPGPDWNGGRPATMYLAKGYFGTALSGPHRVMNNRADGGLVRLCDGPGTDNCTPVPEGTYTDHDFTPATVLEIGV